MKRFTKFLTEECCQKIGNEKYTIGEKYTSENKSLKNV